MNVMLFSATLNDSNPSNNTFPQDPWAIITTVDSRLARFGYPILFILGTIGHLNSFLIFTRPSFWHSSTNFLFIALTISDCIYLLSRIYDFINIGLLIPDLSFDSSTLCRVRSYIQYIAMCCNAWLLASISFDRWIRTRFPFKFNWYCTTRNAFIITIAMLIFFSGFNVYVLLSDYGDLLKNSMTLCGPVPTNPVYNTFVREIWPVLFSIIQTCIPALICIILSIDIFHISARTRRIVRSKRRNRIDNQMLLIMLTRVALFLATNLPFGLSNILLSPVLRKFLPQITVLSLQSIFTFIITINYTIDFYIHCLTSRSFRRELLQLMRCLRRNRRIGIQPAVCQCNRGIYQVKLLEPK